VLRMSLCNYCGVGGCRLAETGAAISVVFDILQLMRVTSGVTRDGCAPSRGQKL
jgi:hypothetical protein